MTLKVDATHDDYLDEVLETRKSFARELTKYGWTFAEEEEELEGMKIMYFVNRFTVTKILFDTDQQILINKSMATHDIITANKMLENL